MKIINSSVELIEENNPFKKIEKIGRICYKSESNITDVSAYSFVDRLIAQKHFAMLEHAVVIFQCNCYQLIAEFSKLPYVVCDDNYIALSLSHLNNPIYRNGLLSDVIARMSATTDRYYRSNHATHEDCIVHNFPWTDDFGDVHNVDIQMITDTSNMSNKLTFHSVKFICDRGVSHELVRHRCAVAQESTRYCNYSKDKFGNELTFIKPAGYDSWPLPAVASFEALCSSSENAYMNMIDVGMTPQQARAVLPNALKTEVVLTMSDVHWAHFFDLRSKGTTGAPHPDMKIVADMAYNLIAADKHIQ